MIAMVGWMMMAMASRAVRVFYAASNAPLTLEDDGGAALPEAPPAPAKASSLPQWHRCQTTGYRSKLPTATMCAAAPQLLATGQPRARTA